MTFNLTHSSPSVRVKYCTAYGEDWQCDRRHAAKGYCRSHYAQHRLGKPLTPIKQIHPTRHAERHISLDDDLIGNDIPVEHQRCVRCETVKPLSEFIKQAHSPGQKSGLCRDCSRAWFLDRTYGDGAAEWKRNKLIEQGNRCAACGTEHPKGKDWHMDHDHKTGEWRDVLCTSCNVEFGIVEKWLADKTLTDWLLKRHGIALYATE